MSILVGNCFHWIGYHLVNHMLEKGWEVDGKDVIDSDKKDHLSMFFGRNDHFRLIHDTEKSHYDTLIIIGDFDMGNIQAERIIQIGENSNRIASKDILTIHVRMLFGEWMPMCEKGIYENNLLVPFESCEFLNEAIYIEDFIKGFMQWLKVTRLPSSLFIKSLKNKEDNSVKLENSVYLRDNRPIEENIKIVLDHFQQFSDLY